MRIGIDVGGTNTDAVLLDGTRLVAKIKTPTTADVTSGILTALRYLLDTSQVDAEAIVGVMIGTTHFTNAVVERRRLQPTAAIRLGLPATRALPPLIDWPADLREAVGHNNFLVHGGHQVDGRWISPIRPDEIRAVAEEIGRRGIRTVAISSVFSPVNQESEERTAQLIREVLPDVAISLAHEIGRIGLLERENAAVLNAALRDLAGKTVRGFREALARAGIVAPLFITQNDGTLMSADYAERYPVTTFSSGPTNSMRGAAFLSGLKDGLVCDIGGTTADVGALTHGFPREASKPVGIGGVRTNFRMPDVLSIGLGGGSLVIADPMQVGPHSVGFELTTKALVFGGNVLTATDIAVAAGYADIGDRAKVAHLSPTLVREAVERIHAMVEEAIDRSKLLAGDVPVVLVGGGSVLINRTLKGTSETIKPPHFEAANAVGAAIAQVSGEVDRIFNMTGMTRDAAMAQAKQEATDRAVAAGADANTVAIVDAEDVPLSYLPGNATRIRVKAVGDLLLKKGVA